MKPAMQLPYVANIPQQPKKKLTRSQKETAEKRHKERHLIGFKKLDANI